MGVDLVEVFGRIRANEALGQNDPYGASTVAALNLALTIAPDTFELVKMMHESFTPNTATGEREGGWPSCLYCAFKIPAASMKVVAENFG